MAKIEQKKTSFNENLKSIRILQSLQNCDRFESDREQQGRIRLYYCNYSVSNASCDFFSNEDFFKAVDYYYKNRMSEFAVDRAMQKPDGLVDVYSPETGLGSERYVVVSLKNYLVPQILEFAYILIRQSQKTK